MAAKKPIIDPSDPSTLPPVPGPPRINVRPISIGEALGLVSSKDVEDAENRGLIQPMPTDEDSDNAALMRPKAGTTGLTQGKHGVKMILPGQWGYKPGVPQDTQNALNTADKIEHNVAVGPVTGAGKEALRTMSGASRIAQRAKSKITGVDPRSMSQVVAGVKPEEVGIFGEHVNDEDVDPTDTSERVGGIGENIAEYLGGEGLLKAIPKVGAMLQWGSKVPGWKGLGMRVLSSAARNAATAGAQDYVKSGGDPESLAEGAEFGGITGAGSEVLGSAARLAKNKLGKYVMRLRGDLPNEVQKDLDRGIGQAVKDWTTVDSDGKPVVTPEQHMAIDRELETRHLEAAKNRPLTRADLDALRPVTPTPRKMLDLSPMTDEDRAAAAYMRRMRMGEPEGRVVDGRGMSSNGVSADEANSGADQFIKDLGNGKTGAAQPEPKKINIPEEKSLPEPGSATTSKELPFPQGVSKIEYGANKVLEGKLPEAESHDPILSHHTFPMKGEGGAVSQNFSTFDSTGRHLGGITYTASGDLGDVATINSSLSHLAPGSGMGRKMYTSLAEDLAKKGFSSLESDQALTPEARRLWNSMMRDNPGIVEKNGRYRWDLNFITPGETGPTGVTSLQNQAENVLSKYDLKTTKPNGVESTPVQVKKSVFDPIQQELAFGMGLHVDDLEKMADEGGAALQTMGGKARNKELFNLLGKGVKYAAIDYAANKAMDELGVPPAAKYAVLGGLTSIQLGRVSRHAFFKELVKKPEVMSKLIQAASKGQDVAGIIEPVLKTVSKLAPAVGNAVEQEPGVVNAPEGYHAVPTIKAPPGYNPSGEEEPTIKPPKGYRPSRKPNSEQ